MLVLSFQGRDILRHQCLVVGPGAWRPFVGVVVEVYREATAEKRGSNLMHRSRVKARDAAARLLARAGNAERRGSLLCHRRSLALTFRTGGMPLFIHWRLPRAATTGHRSLSTATRWRPVRRIAGSGRRWAGAGAVGAGGSAPPSYGVGVRNTPIATAGARGAVNLPPLDFPRAREACRRPTAAAPAAPAAISFLSYSSFPFCLFRAAALVR